MVVSILLLLLATLSVTQAEKDWTMGNMIDHKPSLTKANRDGSGFGNHIKSHHTNIVKSEPETFSSSDDGSKDEPADSNNPPAKTNTKTAPPLAPSFGSTEFARDFCPGTVAKDGLRYFTSDDQKRTETKAFLDALERDIHQGTTNPTHRFDYLHGDYAFGHQRLFGQPFPSDDPSRCFSGVVTYSDSGCLPVFLMNPNCFFWDDKTSDFLDFGEEDCRPDDSAEPMVVTSCDQMKDICDDGEFFKRGYSIHQGNFSFCGSGYYFCSKGSKNGGRPCGGTLALPEQEEGLSRNPAILNCPKNATTVAELDEYLNDASSKYEVWYTDTEDRFYLLENDHSSCFVEILGVPDFDCPPEGVVSSFDELHHYCAEHTLGFSPDLPVGTICEDSPGTHGFSKYPLCERYACRYRGRAVCEGTVDPEKDVPSCSVPVIPDCSATAYYAAHCQEKEDSERIHCGKGSFACWDTQADQWCRGKVSATYETPVCPSTQIKECGELDGYGIDHTKCHCSGFYEGSETFSCYDSETASHWCEGTIDPNPIPQPPEEVPEEEEIDEWDEKESESETKEIIVTGKTIIPSTTITSESSAEKAELDDAFDFDSDLDPIGDDFNEIELGGSNNYDQNHPMVASYYSNSEVEDWGYESDYVDPFQNSAYGMLGVIVVGGVVVGIVIRSVRRRRINHLGYGSNSNSDSSSWQEHSYSSSTYQPIQLELPEVGQA